MTDPGIATSVASQPDAPSVPKHAGPETLSAPNGCEPRSAPHELSGFISLAGVQVFMLVSGLITAPLIAHALGAERRGMLAVVAVPLGVAGYVLQLGLGPFAVNRVAQGARVRVVFGSLALPMLVVGCAVAALSPWIAHNLSKGRQPVDTFLTIGLMLMPISLLVYLAMSLATGLAMWRPLAVARLLSPLSMTVGVVVLSALGKLTLESAIIVTLVSGLVPIAALTPILRRALPPLVDLRLVRSGLSFGGRASVGVVATMANQRLDQFLMIPLVPARQLGLYTVAVTIASLSTVLTSQVVTVVLPRIAAGESHLLARATRYVLLVTVASGAVIVCATSLLLVPLFGSDFAGAKVLVYVLVLGWISQAGLSTLSQGLPAVGRPGAPSVGEVISLAITVPGLIVLLPAMGAMGAALVSLIAYTTTFAVLLAITARYLGDRPTDYFVPRREDIATLSRFARSHLIGTLRRRFAPA